MSHQVRNTYASLFSGLVMFVLYFWRISYLFEQGRFEGAEAMSLLAKTFLLMIPVGIIATVISMILFSILFAIAARDGNPSFVIDERDRLIELRALRWSYYIFGAGFICSMIALAFGHTAFTVFNLIIGSLMLATIAEGLIQLAMHRRGY
ncbi:MAG: hypothetical protein V3V25_05645 [Paracoccaceae bacterium]